MALTKDSKSSKQKLTTLARKGFRRVLDQLRAQGSEASSPDLRDIGIKAWKDITPLRPGRRHTKRNLRAFELSRKEPDFRKVLENPDILGARPKEETAAFCWDCGARSVREGVRKLKLKEGSRVDNQLKRVSSTQNTKVSST